MSPSAMNPKRIEKLVRQLHALAASGIELGQDPSWVETVTEELASGADQGGVLLAAAVQLIQVNQRLQADLAAARSKGHESGGASGEQALHAELGRRFAELRRQGTPFSLLAVETDQFGKLNEQHGPSAGKELLGQVAVVSLEAVRGMDFVAPCAEGWIAAVLPGIGLASAEQVAKRVRGAIADARFAVGGEELQVTVGIGMAEARPDEDARCLIRRAVQAMRAAQQSGRNRICLHNGRTTDPIRPVLRRTRRYSVDKIQRIAPYVDGQSPEEAGFQEVLCTDLSPGGFAYLVDERPAHRRLIVELGTGGNRKYLVAVVKNCVRVASEAGEQFRVGCMFTGRLGPDEAPASRPPEVGQASSLPEVAPAAGLTSD
jgi:diguanylate cyclase (GGDEF)-like protein